MLVELHVTLSEVVKLSVIIVESETNVAEVLYDFVLEIDTDNESLSMRLPEVVSVTDLFSV